MISEPPWTFLATLQRKLMARSPYCEFACWSVHMRPADRVSGDFCVIGRRTGDRLWGAFGDVMGHGPSAASVNVAILAELGHLANCSPAQRLAGLNAFLENDQGLFATAMSFDLGPAGDCLLSSAGHPPALLMESSATRPVPESTGAPLGLFGVDESYAEHHLQLRPQQRLLFVSDGFLERNASSARTKALPLRIQQGLMAAASGNALKEDIVTMRRLLEAAVNGRRKAADDQTLLLLEYRGASKADEG